MNEALIQHESGHAAACLMLGYSPLEVSVASSDGSGYVEWRQSDRWADPQTAHDFAQIVLAGRIAEDEPDWPPDWPPSRAKSNDESQLAALAEYLELDRGGWRQLCADALELAASPEFARTEHIFRTALEARPHLDGEFIRRLCQRTIQTPVSEGKAHPMLHKAFELLETKADPGETGGQAGEFTALVSAFGNVDSDGDRIVFGAYSRTLERWRQSGDPIPVILSHKWDDPHAHLGVADAYDVKETPRGLLVKGQLDIEDNDVARQVYKLMKRRSLKEFSIGYRVPPGGEAKAADGANEITEIDLVEFGPTLKGVNSETRLQAVKAAAALAVPDDASQRRRFAAVKASLPRSSTELRGACARLRLDIVMDGVRRPDPEPVGPSAAELRKRYDDLRLGLAVGDTDLSAIRAARDPEPAAPADAELRDRAKALGLRVPVSPERRIAEQARDDFLALMLAADVAQTPARPPSREEADLKRRSRETMLDIRVGTRN